MLDVVCLQLSFFLAYVIWQKDLALYTNEIYANLSIVLILIDVCVMFCLNTCKNVLKRGAFEELAKTMRHSCIVMFAAVFYLFFVKTAGDFSRMTLFLTTVFYVLISYALRLLWKKHLLRKMKAGNGRSVVILTDYAYLPHVQQNIRNGQYAFLGVHGIAVTGADEKPLPKEIGGIPLVSHGTDVLDELCHAWVDEVLIELPIGDGRVEKLMEQLTEMGLTVHAKLASKMEFSVNRRFVQQLGGYTVLTASIRTVTLGELAAKRFVDIVGSLVGCALTGILFLVLAPFIYRQSPGPIFFGQTRVGKNGKKFTLYKFRSMVPDAEEKKAFLAAQNRVPDGMMFKLDFDPRIIGCRQLADGTVKKGIGNFMRDWSLDEFPQFWNVLKGDMSLVGTRPPTEDEWVKYELHHRSRLAIKPGITGLWQVSGRSRITEFEKVVELDRTYIMNWSLLLDVKILLKTVRVVLRHDGAM